MTYAIEARALSKSYGTCAAVQAIDLRIRPGELYALLGINGAGKSTTIRLLSCLAKPTGGDALLLGHSIRTEPNQIKQELSVSPQESAVAPNLTVQENLELMAGIYGIPAPRSQAEVTLRRFGLEAVAKRRAKALSGGWQRRLSIAMALISQPKILFLDEPTLGLDVLARRELWQAIRELKGKTTCILTTHDLAEARALADRIGILVHGRLAAEGTVAELLALAETSQWEDAFVKLAGGVNG